MKYADGGNKLFFIYNTTVAKCKSFDGPMNSFKFVNFQTILDNGVETDLTIDLIGDVVQVYELETHAGPNKNTLKQTLVMEDLRGLKVFVTLWGDYASQVVDYISKHANISCLIMIIQFGRLKFFGGRAYVKNTIAATKLFINKDIEEVREFKELLSIKGYDTASSTRTIGSSILYSLRDEFIVKHPLYRISQIHEIDEGCSGIIVGTIKNVEDRYSWYYIACSICKTKVQKKDGSISQPGDLLLDVNQYMFLCTKTKCQDKNFSAEPSFILKVRVQGMSGVVTLTMFERDVKCFLKMTAIQLFENQKKTGNPGGFPIELYNLLEQKIAFKIIVKVSTFAPYTRYYNISKWTDDMEIIAELEKLESKKTLSEQGEYEDSVSLSMTESASQFTVNLKDSDSFTDDNTPISDKLDGTCTSPLTKTSRSRLKSPPKDAKRKLIEVYDLDELVGESATKPVDSSNTKTVLNVEQKLLIPKLENYQLALLYLKLFQIHLLKSYLLESIISKGRRQIWLIYQYLSYHLTTKRLMNQL
ncbi:hypothetical protein LXL04_016919 [Taraxacum kok-saghyz]